MSKQYEPIHGEIIRTTERAVLVLFLDGEDDWIPRSVCEDGDALEIGDNDVRVERWFAEKEGLS